MATELDKARRAKVQRAAEDAARMDRFSKGFAIMARALQDMRVAGLSAEEIGRIVKQAAAELNQD